MADPVQIILRESIILRVESVEDINAGGCHVTSLNKYKVGTSY
jgi:hypothetical protein